VGGCRVIAGWDIGAPFEGQQFLPVNRNVPGGFDPQANFATVDIDDRNTDIFPDEDFLTELSAQYQHLATLL
jgi:hypothetical protein